MEDLDAIYKQERFKESSSLFDALKDNAKNDVDLAKINHNHGNSLMKENKTRKKKKEKYFRKYFTQKNKK